jgi:hypothetical protein
MKTIYKILFFIATLLLALLSSELFKMIDKRAGAFTISLITLSMLACIASMLFFLLQYTRQPLPGKDHTFYP